MGARGAALAVFVALAPCARLAYAQSEADQAVAVPAGDEYADTDPSALSDFRAALDPSGTWEEDPSYGTVWTPDPAQVGPGFQPYDTAGSWEYVDGDPVWVSDYDWGWVCFHYGRWAWSGGSWVWIPGREYATAWVSWRIGDDGLAYVGWAPLAPAWIWVGGSAMTLAFGSPEPWTFAANGDFLAPGIAAHSVTGYRAVPMVGRTRPYVRAQPSVAAAPVPHGPAPALLGLDVTRLALAPLSAREVRARQLSRPSTAQPLGARPPAAHLVHAAGRGLTWPRGAGAPARAAPSRGRR
jgi:hypothetical protein